MYYEITLVRKPLSCPLCGKQMIGHGHKLRTIHHPAFRDHKGIILYNANRYICKDCRKTTLEKNPFTFEGFNASFFLLQNAMRLLGNLNYNLQMISDELNISTTQLCKYLDSYVTIPPRPLPECLGIDELYNKYLSRRNSSYLCVLDSFPVLAKAYDLKEEYRKFNRESTYDDACEKLMEISKKFKNSGIRQFDEFTAILFHWQEEILNTRSNFSCSMLVFQIRLY